MGKLKQTYERVSEKLKKKGLRMGKCKKWWRCYHFDNVRKTWYDTKSEREGWKNVKTEVD